VVADTIEAVTTTVTTADGAAATSTEIDTAGDGLVLPPGDPGNQPAWTACSCGFCFARLECCVHLLVRLGLKLSRIGLEEDRLQEETIKSNNEPEELSLWDDISV
jgi:hypothetical protein